MGTSNPFGSLGSPQGQQNPLGWPGQTQTNMPSGGTSSPNGILNTTNPFTGAGSGSNQNPYGQGTRGGGNQGFNLAQTNLQTGLMKNSAIPSYYQNMMNLAGPAGNYFQQLMNLGSPYYQQQQTASLNQGVQQSQNAAAQSKAQLAGAGYGYAPSGLEAGMLGQQATGQAQNLSSTYLQNLFNNEQMQALGAQGLSQLAQLFNPTQLLTSQISPNIQQPTNTGAEWLSSVAQLVGGASGFAKGGSGGGSNG